MTKNNFFYRLIRKIFFILDNRVENDEKPPFGEKVKVYEPYSIYDTEIGDYSYIARNSTISKTKIGKFCSIGPNLLCGWGIHPTNGISTNPMFHSNMKQNGYSLCEDNKIIERKEITIGNDVFIGANVTLLDGVKIGDGVIIGAGAVVVSDIPDYAIAVGVPAKVKKYRFDIRTIKKLKKLEWWNWDLEQLKTIEMNFFDIEKFISENT